MEDLMSPGKVTAFEADTFAVGELCTPAALAPPLTSGFPFGTFGPSKSIITLLSVCGVGVPDRARPLLGSEST